MPKTITIGTAISKPGEIQYGRWDTLSHPTGHTEFLPVIIAQGREEGPCIWLTAGIHGDEHAGPLVLYTLITQELVDKLRGTIVAIPALNPAGLRTQKREPYHLGKDPNRLWPDGKPQKNIDPEKVPPSSLEKAYERLFGEILSCADYLIDYHNAWIGSISFAFRDRVLYRADENEAENKTKAEALTVRQDEMLRAYGHTVINEFSTKNYIDEDLHRSTSGAAFLLGRIPSFTVELGAGLMPDSNIIAAACAGTRNVLRWAGMLGGEMEPSKGIKVVDPGFPVRRSRTLRVDSPCIILDLVKSGDIVSDGDPLAELRDLWGRPLEGESIIRAGHDGFILSPSHGIYFYPGQAVMYMAIRDEEPLISPYPDDFFKDES